MGATAQGAHPPWALGLIPCRKAFAVRKAGDHILKLVLKANHPSTRRLSRCVKPANSILATRVPHDTGAHDASPQGEADAVVAAFLNKPLPAKSGIAFSFLRSCGPAPLLDQPPHAVIDLGLRLARAIPKRFNLRASSMRFCARVAERGKNIGA